MSGEQGRQAQQKAARKRTRRAVGLAKSLSKELQLLASTDGADPDHWRAHAATTQRTLAALEADSTEDPNSAAPTPDQLWKFGRLLRDRRIAAGLSRVELARRAKLSDATIKFTETARHPVTRATLIRLCNVRELGLSWSDAIGVLGTGLIGADPELVEQEARDAMPSQPLNSYLPPADGSLVRQYHEATAMLRAGGGQIPSSTLYACTASAAEYLDYCGRSPDETELATSLPHFDVARAIGKACQGQSLHMVSFGPGDGHAIARLADATVEHCRDLGLTLIDLSAPLLVESFGHASRFLSGRAAWVHGAVIDCTRVALHAGLVESPRRRVFIALGRLLDDLPNPLQFLQYGMPFALPGDLLVLDFRVAVAQRPEEIRKREPWLNAPLSAAAQQWLTGPLWRSSPSVSAVEIEVELETTLSPADYAMDVRATVRHRDRKTASRFSVSRRSCYDADRLAGWLDSVGWSPVARLGFGVKARACVLVCEWQPVALRAHVRVSPPSAGLPRLPARGKPHQTADQEAYG